MHNNQEWTVETMRALTVLWRTLPLRGVTDERGTMEDYCEALREFSNAAIWNVVFALRDGTIEGASDEWSPRAPKLARWVREEQSRLDNLADLERRKSAKLIDQERYRAEEHSAEHRVRMLGQWNLLMRSMHGDRTATEELARKYPNAGDPFKARYPNIHSLGTKP